MTDHQLVRFVILFQGRSGSTYLVDSLRSNPRMLTHYETLVNLKEKGSSAQIAWMRRFYTIPRPAPLAAVGFKAKLSDVLDLEPFADLLRILTVRVIHLERRNLVKQAISWLNSERLHEATGAWNLYDVAETPPPFEVDPVKFAEYLDLLEQGQLHLRRYVSRLALPTLHLSYEQLLVDYDSSMRKALDFLQVPFEPMQPAVKKTTSDDLALVVLNLKDLRAQYVGTRYEPMFDERPVGEQSFGQHFAVGAPSVPGTHRPSDQTRFVVVSEARTGSNLLLGLLNSHKNAILFGELLNPRTEVRRRAAPDRYLDWGDDPVQYLKSYVYREHRASTQAAGFKLFYSHARNDKWKHVWAYLRDSGVRVIHLTRTNLLDRYLSYQLALRSGRWVQLEGEQSSPEQPIVIDPRDCFKSFHKSLWYQEQTEHFFSRGPLLRVTFESLCDDMAAETNGIQEFLGIEVRHLTARLCRQRRQTKTELIQNYDALREELRHWVDSGWAREEWLDFFDDA